MQASRVWSGSFSGKDRTRPIQRQPDTKKHGDTGRSHRADRRCARRVCRLAQALEVHDDASDLPKAEVERFVSRAEAAIYRVAGRPSPYADQSERVFKNGGYPGLLARSLAGILQSLRTDLAAGYVRSHRELVHAELFADFLEMAEHLLNEGYKDAAAVIAGSSLEAHLRRLCQKSGITLEISSGASTTPKKADRLNSDLAGTGWCSNLIRRTLQRGLTCATRRLTANTRNTRTRK